MPHMSKKDRRKVVAMKINAGHDRNGNPRRGWLVYTSSGEYRGFVDEGYGGRKALTSLFPNAVDLGTIPTTPGAYRDAKRERITGGY